MKNKLRPTNLNFHVDCLNSQYNLIEGYLFSTEALIYIFFYIRNT